MKHLLVTACLAALIAPANGDAFVVTEGRPNAEIVIAEEPPRAAGFGALELQACLEKISGARLGIVSTPTAGRPIKIYVGDSGHARQAGVTSDGLKRDAFHMVSGKTWLALVGNDQEFEPREPWAREKEAAWRKLAGKPWVNPIGRSLCRDHDKQLVLWSLDHRGSLNAVCQASCDLSRPLPLCAHPRAVTPGITTKT